MSDADWPIPDGPFEGLVISELDTDDLEMLASVPMDVCWVREAIVGELRRRGVDVIPPGPCGAGGMDVNMGPGPLRPGPSGRGPMRGREGPRPSRPKRPRPGPRYHHREPRYHMPPPEPIDVDRDALARIRRQMAAKYHPDKPDGDADKMSLINTLLDMVEKARKR